MKLGPIIQALNNYSDLHSQLDFKTVIEYIDLVCLLKPDLCQLCASYQQGPPDHLSIDIHKFLVVSLSISDDIAKMAWQALHYVAWEQMEGDAVSRNAGIRDKYLKMFLKYGLCQGIGVQAHLVTSKCHQIDR
jgi:hypothetical protein